MAQSLCFTWELSFPIHAEVSPLHSWFSVHSVLNAQEVHTGHNSNVLCVCFIYYAFTQVGKKLPNQAPDPKLAFYSERWGQRCIIHILVHNTEAKLFSEVSPVWKLLPPSLPTPKTYCIFTRATSIRPTPPPLLFFGTNYVKLLC